MPIAPPDEHDRVLDDNVHPADWTNPVPAGRYNLVAVGGGTAGIVAALVAAGMGAKAALVEQRGLGGDCLNFGCVPSKALLRAARAVYQASLGERFGFRLTKPPQADFPAVMQRMRRLRATISQHDAAARFRGLGVDVFFGQAAFIARDTLKVGESTLRFRRAVIATGTSPTVPAVDGLSGAGYLTNETVFSLGELPRRLIVVGGGPVGCELAQAFRRFGSEVHLVGRVETLLPKEPSDAAKIVEDQFGLEGIHLHLGWTTLAAEKMGDSKSLLIERRGERKKLIADAILIAAGRNANVAGLGLEAAGVRYSNQGVEVNDRLQTSNTTIYAAGDVCSRVRFTHAADAMARLCVQNALFLGRKKFSSLVIPRATFTDPEVAHVGLSAADAEARRLAIDTYRVELVDVDRALLDGEENGFVVVHTRRGTGRVVGATIVASHAGEMVGELSLMMANKLSLGALARTIHCYPTQVEAFKRIADAYTRRRFTPWLANLAAKWLEWRR
jgi:pyruvate/2-oxoglutarate dehydrogenase complex dihydrolipoamide dehydrogenase (E3) component